MEARLQRLGTDFGNGARDQQAFQLDREALRYRRAKGNVSMQRYGILDEGQAERKALEKILEWMGDKLKDEHPGAQPPKTSGENLFAAYANLANFLQEDFAIVQQRPGDAGDRTIAVFVAFPSSWRPEAILGESFLQIHAPVPGFADLPLQADSMVASMVERGPYVRFVWTLTADDALDHHPEEGERRSWRAARSGWLRVERQVTVPFSSEASALFLIRTYLYPFASLQETERGILRRSLERMPREVANYKGLDDSARTVAQRLLAEASPEGNYFTPTT